MSKKQTKTALELLLEGYEQLEKGEEVESVDMIKEVEKDEDASPIALLQAGYIRLQKLLEEERKAESSD